MLDHLNGRHPIWLNQIDKFRIVHYAGPHKPWHKLKDPKGKKLDTDLIWRRYFAALVIENGWKKEDFLAPLASQKLRNNLRYDEWMTAI
jgi:lipopolysaccharide biosynthesis glycosyltransferase